jgi:2-polyprenyl-3-methyl-5-hydroxy-6-metoxy-1,4-benzoquinol methylase
MIKRTQFGTLEQSVDGSKNAFRVIQPFPPGSSTATPLNVAYRLGKICKLGLLKGRWLDFGCADGSYAAAMVELGADSAVGVDVLPDRIVEAQRKCQISVEVQFLHTSTETLPFADDYFDGVLMNEVLEHVTNEVNTLRELRRVIRPGGHLVIMSPNRWFPFEGHGAHLGKLQLRWPVAFLPWLPAKIGRRFMNARNYWPYELQDLVSKERFSISVVDFVWPVLEVYRWLPESLIRLYQKAIPKLEKIPAIRRLGVSVFLVAQKREEATA